MANPDEFYNKALGLKIVRRIDEDEHDFEDRRGMVYGFSMGFQAREAVYNMCPDFFVYLEKSETTGEKKSLGQQRKIVSKNMAKWVGRWVVLANWVEHGQGTGKWIVDREVWREEQRSDAEGWSVIDEEWKAKLETKGDNWWNEDESKFKALGILNKAFKKIFWDAQKPHSKFERYAMICGFVMGKLASNSQLEQFTQELVKEKPDTL